LLFRTAYAGVPAPTITVYSIEPGPVAVTTLLPRRTLAGNWLVWYYYRDSSTHVSVSPPDQVAAAE
jgi:hypothetical protein